jgi:micrococcal nuclease
MEGHRSFGRAGISLAVLMFLMLPAFLVYGDMTVVAYVIDGDTVILENDETLRYIGIDTPEIDHQNKRAEPLGYAARSFNLKLLGSQRIRLEYDQEKQDHYNRLLAYVYLPDSTFVNMELLRSGLATYLHKPPNLKHEDRLLTAQREAMLERKGIWHAWSETKQSYVGNQTSKRFHRPTCPYGKKTAPANRVSFSKQWDAYWHGYAPCKRCLK